VAREIENGQQQYAVSRVCEQLTLPVSRVRERLTFGDWTQEKWDQMEAMGGHDNVSSVLGPYRYPSPPPPVSSGQQQQQQQQQSSASFIADVLEPIEHPSPTPSSSSAQEPIQLIYQRATATDGPTYALQISASLRLQAATRETGAVGPAEGGADLAG
jgi:hypothetical protein